MSNRSEKFFIFTWKEITVISLMTIISLGFFFTLGLHYGKKIHGGEAPEAPESKLDTSPDIIPAKETLEEAARHALVATEETITQATQDQVKKSKLKIETVRQVNLPSNVKKPKAESDLAPKPSKSEGKYLIQVGSFPSLSDAKTRVTILKKRGIEAKVKSVRIGGNTRYRVVVSGYDTVKAATAQASEWKRAKKIEAFVVIPN